MSREPDYQFGIRQNNSAGHRIIVMKGKALEEIQICPIVFLDVAQAFENIWQKLNKILPKQFV